MWRWVRWLTARWWPTAPPPLSSAAFFARAAKQHRTPWNTILRRDPCCYCGATTGQTIEHITPRLPRNRSHKRGPVENKACACYACNHARGHMPLLLFLIARQTGARSGGSKPRTTPRKVVRPVRLPVPLRVSIGDQIRWKQARS